MTFEAASILWMDSAYSTREKVGTRGQESNREMQEWRGEKKQMRMRIEERAEKEGRGEKEKDETRGN